MSVTNALLLMVLLLALSCAAEQRAAPAKRPAPVHVVASAPATPSASLPSASLPSDALELQPLVALPPPAHATGPELGTAHPLGLVIADPGGRWVMLAQARHDTNKDGRIAVTFGGHGEVFGDRMHPYLVFGAGDGTVIDEFLGASPNGDALAFVRDQRLFVASAKGIVTELGRCPHRGLGVKPSPLWSQSFDPSGARFVYRAARGGRVVVLVRELATGKENVIDPGSGHVDFAQFDPSGAWISVHVIDESAARRAQKRAQPGDLETSLLDPVEPQGHVESCGGDLGGRRVAGDTREVRVAPVGSDATARPVEGLIAPVGRWLLRRGASGELLALAQDGTEETLARASCGAQVLQIDSRSERVVVACALPDPKHAKMAILGPKLHIELGISTPQRDVPPLYAGGEGRLLTIDESATGAAGAPLTLVDIREASYRRFPARNFAPLALVDSLMLFARVSGNGADLVSLDAGSGIRRDWGTVPSYWKNARNGALFATSPFVFDLERGGILGRFSGEPLAVDKTGRVLLAQPRPPSVVPNAPLMGPLRWTALTAASSP